MPVTRGVSSTSVWGNAYAGPSGFYEPEAQHPPLQTAEERDEELIARIADAVSQRLPRNLPMRVQPAPQPAPQLPQPVYHHQTVGIADWIILVITVAAVALVYAVTTARQLTHRVNTLELVVFNMLSRSNAFGVNR